MAPQAKKKKRADLRSISIFSRLDGSSEARLSALMRKLKLEKGQTLFSEGQGGDELFVLLSGRIAISVKPETAEPILLSEIGPGGFFGEMAIIDGSPRSADCRALEDCKLLALGARDFDIFLEKDPAAAIRILDTMLEISSERLIKTGVFLSDMVRWGEVARLRAVTDPATGLFNRRYMEEKFPEILLRLQVEGKQACLVMFDMDHFGSLNREYGQAVGDRIILAAAASFRSVFDPRDILVRYGGDEFVFLLPESAAQEGQEACDALCAAFREIRIEGQPSLRLSCSMGYAVFPAQAQGLESLCAAADRALYLAKEAGRDRALGFSGYP